MPAPRLGPSSSSSWNLDCWVPKSRMPIMSLGLEMMRCCMIWYAHFRAAVVALSVSGFLELVLGGGASMEGLTSMAKRIASFWSLYSWDEGGRGEFGGC